MYLTQLHIVVKKGVIMINENVYWNRQIKNEK